MGEPVDPILPRTIRPRLSEPDRWAEYARRGALIRQIREAAGVTRPEVTARLGWSRDLLAGYETGHHPISEDQFDRVLAAVREVALAKGTL